MNKAIVGLSDVGRVLLAGWIFLSSSIVFAAALPDYYQEPGFNSFRNVQLGSFGESIDPFNGGLQLHISPIVLHGNGDLDIEILLTYRSVAKQASQLGPDHKSWPSPFGLGWDLHMGRIWPGSNACPGKNSVNGSDDYDRVAPVLELADGTRRALVAYTGTGDFDLITKDRWAAKCDDTNNQYIVYSPTGVKYYFPKIGHAISQGSGLAYSVTKIVDANNNTINVEYLTNPNYQLVQKVYFSGKPNQGVTLSYTQVQNNNYYNLASITANGQTWEFGFTPVQNVSIGHYFLTTIDPPAAKTWTFKYLDPSQNGGADNAALLNLASMNTPTGVKTAYTYAYVAFDETANFADPLAVAVSSKTVSGTAPAGTWQYSYAPGTSTANSVTTVTTPIGTEKYTYFSSKQANTNNVWQIGTLLNQQWLQGNSVVKEIKYVWQKDLISPMRVYNRRRPVDNSAVYDLDTWAPQLAERTTILDGSEDKQFKLTLEDYDLFGNAGKQIESGYDGATIALRTRLFAFDVKLPNWILHLVSSEKIKDATGAITRTHDNAGRLTLENTFAVSTQYSRCTNGEINKITQANGNTTTYTCADYQAGIPKSEARGSNSTADQVTIKRAVDDAGRVISESIAGAFPNPDGTYANLTTDYKWDDLNRLTGITTPEQGDSNISIDWSEDGGTRKLTRGSYTETQTRDGLGQITKISYPGFSQTFSYDALGRKTFASNLGSGSVGTSFSYDVIGRMQKQDPPGEGDISYAYLNGLEQQITDQLNHSTTYSYRAYDETSPPVLRKIDVSGNTTTLNRDPWGFITSVVQGDVTRRYSYNVKKQLTGLEHPEIGQVNFGRDGIGNMTSLQIGTGAITNFTYTALNQLKTVNYADPNTPDETRTYSKTGQLTSATTAGYWRWNYRYTRNDQLSEEAITYLAGSAFNAGADKTFKITYQRDNLDHVVGMIYPSRLNYQARVDSLGRTAQLQLLNGNALVQSAQYWPNGQLQQLVYGNNKTTRFEQDDQLKTTSTRSGDLDPADTNAEDGLNILNAFVQEAYTYNGKGLLTNLSDQIQPSFSLSNLAYDNQDRLTHLNGAEIYRYDNLHNITYNNVNSRNATYQYAANQQLTRITNTPYVFQYDARGNVSSNGKDSFTYDEANHLRALTNRNWQLGYDAHGKRVAQLKNGKTIYSFYGLKGQLLFDLDEQTNQQHDYLYVGNQMVSKLAMPITP